MAQFNLGRVKGDKGDTGKSFRIRGAWATNTEYLNNDATIDVVNHSGCAYACKITHTSSSETAPPNETSWELLLSNEFDIVHTDTINDTTKIPSSAVTYALGQEIDTLASAIGALRLVQKGESGATSRIVTFTATNASLYLFVAARASMGHGCMYLIRSAGGSASFTPIKENTDICTLSHSGLTLSINLKQSYTVYSIIRLADL